MRSHLSDSPSSEEPYDVRRRQPPLGWRARVVTGLQRQCAMKNFATNGTPNPARLRICLRIQASFATPLCARHAVNLHRLRTPFSPRNASVRGPRSAPATTETSHSPTRTVAAHLFFYLSFSRVRLLSAPTHATCLAGCPATRCGVGRCWRSVAWRMARGGCVAARLVAGARFQTGFANELSRLSVGWLLALSAAVCGHGDGAVPYIRSACVGGRGGRCRVVVMWRAAQAAAAGSQSPAHDADVDRRTPADPRCQRERGTRRPGGLRGRRRLRGAPLAAREQTGSALIVAGGARMLRWRGQGGGCPRDTVAILRQRGAGIPLASPPFVSTHR